MQNNYKILNEMLIEANILNPEQLEEVLAIQKKTGEWLGKLLIQLGYISEAGMIGLLEKQFGMTYVEMAAMDVPRHIAAIIPMSVAERYQVIPIKKDGRQVTLAMADPTNFYAIDDVRMISGCEVNTVIASEREIMRAISQCYGVQELVEKAVNQLKADDSSSIADTYVADDAPIVNIVNSIISQAIKERASDIHIEPQDQTLRVRFRIDGVLREVINFPSYSHAAIVSRIKIMSEMDIAEKRVPQDGRIRIQDEDRDIDLRVSTLPTIIGEKVVLRILNNKEVLKDINGLGFNPENFSLYFNLYQQAYGMVLVTGPTGSGKTTTLYSTLAEINCPDRNIITIEDPVEYQIRGISQVQVNPRTGLTFANGLRSILRQDPNIILVGEIRDSETADIAIRAALTGHLVFSTLHTNDAPGAVTRLVDMGIEPFLVASSLLGIVAQRLVRLICTECKESYVPEDGSVELRYAAAENNLTGRLYRGQGCPRCNHTGYYGRMAIHEVMAISGALRDAIQRKVASDTLRDIAVREGMKTMRQDGIDKAMRGLTTLNEVMRVAYTRTG
jgi:type IV pilus assembly protein PilB